jgi:hypothetical protein
MIIAIAILIAVVFYLMRRIGDTVPALLFIGLGITAIFLVPPKAPVGWQIGLIFAAPLFAAVAYKALRRDKRGTKGSRLP